MSAFYPLAAFFVFSSFAFGCMEAWSIATCEAILFLGAAVVGWNDREFWSIPRRLWLPALLAAVLIVVGLLQLVPLPASWWKAGSAERLSLIEEAAEGERLVHTDAYRRSTLSAETAPLPAESWAPEVRTPGAWVPASFAPFATGRALLALAAGLCLILLLERLLEEDRARLRALGWLVGALGVAIALVALAQSGAAKTALLGLRESRHAAQALGPFVHPNHGGAFLNLAFSMVYFLVWKRSHKVRRSSDRWGLRSLVLGLLCLHVAVVVTCSVRAALFPLLLLPPALGWHLLATGRKRIGAAVLGLSLAGAVSAGAFLSANHLLSSHGRGALLRDLPFRHSLIGCGVGSFESLHPMLWRELPALSPTRNTHLENEYAQLLFEGGIVPALLGLAVGLAALYLAVQTCASGGAAFWLSPALAAEVVHAGVDFTGHVFPVVGAFLLACLLSMAAVEQHQEADVAPHGRREAR